MTHPNTFIKMPLEEERKTSVYERVSSIREQTTLLPIVFSSLTLSMIQYKIQFCTCISIFQIWNSPAKIYKHKNTSEALQNHFLCLYRNRLSLFYWKVAFGGTDVYCVPVDSPKMFCIFTSICGVLLSQCHRTNYFAYSIQNINFFAPQNFPGLNLTASCQKYHNNC